MTAPPTVRVRELETLLAKIRHAGLTQLHYDMWDRWGSQHATPEQRAAMDADFAEASRSMTAAKAELEALVAATRARAPHEILAWVDAHDAYLDAFIDECIAQGEAARTEHHVAKGERAQWGEVRAGTRAFADENVYYVTMNADRYRRLFGIDPQTFEHVG